MPSIRNLKRKSQPRRLPRNNGLARLVQGRRPNLAGINSIMQEIRGFIVPVEILKVPRAEQRKLIRHLKEEKSKYSGAALARKRKIVVPAQFNPKTQKYVLAWGCYQESSILQTALEELARRTQTRLNPRMVLFKRTKGNPHITVFFELKGKTYEADAFNNTIKIADVLTQREAITLGKRILTFEELKAYRQKPAEDYPVGI